MKSEPETDVSIDDVDFSGITSICVRDLTHPQTGWALSANGVSVWCEVTSQINGEYRLEVFIADRPR